MNCRTILKGVYLENRTTGPIFFKGDKGTGLFVPSSLIELKYRDSEDLRGKFVPIIICYKN